MQIQDVMLCSFSKNIVGNGSKAQVLIFTPYFFELPLREHSSHDSCQTYP
jgi:hypothetical protein